MLRLVRFSGLVSDTLPHMVLGVFQGSSKRFSKGKFIRATAVKIKTFFTHLFSQCDKR